MCGGCFHRMLLLYIMCMSRLGIPTPAHMCTDRWTRRTIFSEHNPQVCGGNCISDMSRAGMISSNYIQPVGLSEAQRMFACSFTHNIHRGILPLVTFPTQTFWVICGHGLLNKWSTVSRVLQWLLPCHNPQIWISFFCSFLAISNFPHTPSLSLPLSFLGCYDMRPCCTVTGNDGWSLWMSNTIRAMGHWSGERARERESEGERNRSAGDTGPNLGVLI